MKLRTTQKHREDVIFLLIGAILTGLTVVFPEVGFLQWVSMIPLVLGAYRICADEDVGLFRAYRYGFLTVFIYYFVIYHWFVELYPLDFVGLNETASIVVVLAGWIGLSLLQAIVGGFIFVLFRMLDKTDVFKRCSFLRPFVFSALWVIFEWTATLSWTGVPWGKLCLGQIRCLPMLQGASLLGSYVISWLIVTVNALLAYALLRRTVRFVCIGLAAILLVGNLSFGLFSLSGEFADGDRITVAAIQGNINSHDKWNASSLYKTKQAYAELTKKAVKEGAELVVWPETVLPYDLNHRTDLKEYLSDLANDCGVMLVVGAFYEDEGGEEYNALYLFDANGEMYDGYYAKRHLVPFGEYVPMQKLIETLIPPLAELSKLGGGMTAGEGTEIFDTEIGKLGSLICFDTIYEQLAIDTVRDGAEIILVSSNDSWFFDSAAVYQHQAQSQLRAIESGRYVVRAANTGISSIIAPDGSVKKMIDPLEEGYIVDDIAVVKTPTLYMQIGNLFVCLCILFVALVGGVGMLLRRRGLPDPVGRPRAGVKIKE